MNAGRVAASWPVLAKSLGEMTFFCTMEKTISTWFSQEACTGVWIMMALGQASRSRRMAFVPRWSEPLSTMTNTRPALLSGSALMTWPISAMNGAIPVVAGVEANTFPVWASRAASSASAPWRSYSCSTRIGRPGAGGLVGWHRARAWMEGLASTQMTWSPGGSRLPWQYPWYRSRMTVALAAKSGSRGEIQDWYCQGLMGCSAKIRKTEEGEICRASPALVNSAASSGPLQRASGTPVAAGSWQASAITAARSSALIRCGRPDRGRSLSPSRPRAANRPRHLRTVSTLMCRSAAMRALARPHAAASTICARRQSRYAVLAPRARFFNLLRSPALSITGTARYCGMPPPGSSPGQTLLPGPVIITGHGDPARHNEVHGRHPAIHPRLNHRAAARPRRSPLAPAHPGPSHLPRRLRLPHRDTPRRPAHPALPPALRRLSAFLRLRDLLRRPQPLPRRRPAHRAPHRHPATSPRHRLHHPPRRARPRARPLTPPRPPTNLRGHPLRLRVPASPDRAALTSERPRPP